MKTSAQKVVEITKSLFALAPAAVLFAVFTYVAIEMFEWDVDINSWLLMAMWMIPLWLFVENREEGKKRWDRVIVLWTCIGGGLFGASLSLMALSLLLQQTLGINILEYRNSFNLIAAVWVGWILGSYFYLQYQEERRMQEQIEKLRRGESVFQNLKPKVIAQVNKECELEARANASEQVGHILTDTEWEDVKGFREKQREALENDNRERISSETTLEYFRWSDKRRAKDKREYEKFIDNHKH